MPEIPKDALDANRLLYPKGLDGETQVPLMKQLAQIAQELHKEFPEFCGLVPFGSRTKGLSYSDSDLDIFGYSISKKRESDIPIIKQK